MGWRWYWKSWERCEDLVHKSWRLTQSILLIGTILPLVLVFWKLHTGSPAETRTAPVVSSITRPVESAAVVSITDSGVQLRPLLPFSVIPGGARDVAELRMAIAHDPVVAMHYLEFDISKARVVQLDRDRSMYVSYRMGENVYWTHKKLVLFRGETLLTDGQHLARTRCGNRLSETPEVPTLMKEPDRAALETPAPELAGIMAPPAELPLSPISPLPVPAPEITPVSGPGIFIPPIIPIFWGSGTPGSPGTPGLPLRPPRPGPPGVPLAPPPPVVGIPEPSSLLLLCAGLSAVGLATKKRRR
jgi:PEP-CTERM motif